MPCPSGARRSTICCPDTFNSILRIEEQSLDNRLTHGLTITEVHTIVAIGLHERNPMNVVAARLGVTLATLTTAVSKLAGKGFVERIARRGRPAQGARVAHQEGPAGAAAPTTCSTTR